MKDYIRTRAAIIKTQNDPFFKWVDKLTNGGMAHFGIIAEGDSVLELVKAGDIVTYSIPSEDPAVDEDLIDKISTEVVEKDGTLYLSDGETPLAEVVIWEIWFKSGVIMECVAARDEDGDLIPLKN